MRRLLRLLLHWPIALKLAVMAVAGALCMVLVAVTVLLLARQELVAERTQKAHAVVDSIWSMADQFQHEAAAGKLTEAEAKARFFAAAGSIWWEGHTNYAFIYDTETARNLMNTGNTALVGRDMRGAKDAHGLPFAAMMLDIAQRQGEGTLVYAFPKGTNPAPLPKIAFFRAFGPWHMLIISAEYIADIDDTFWHMTRTAAMLIGGLLVVSLGVAWAAGRSIVRPLSALRARMATLQAGDLAAAVPGVERGDEVGEMARGVGVFRDHMVRENELAVAHEAERASTEKAQRRAALIGMAETVESETATALQSISARTGAIATTADAMRGSADRTGGSAQDAAAAAAQALANAQSVASAAEQLAASIREIGGQVTQSNAVVGRAVGAGAEARATIEALNQEVEKIGAVADMIGEIAARTNLLALNATIEAARAGDAGKGFAVVAAEVKALATQTAHSTRDIARHIGEVRSATGASVAAVARIEQDINEVNAIASAIAAAVEQQGASTAEIARNVAGTADAANQVTSRITEVSTEATGARQLAAEVRDNIVALNQAVEELRHSVIRAVRGSTSDVDRRRTPRYPIDLGARLTIGGVEQAGRIADLSAGGAFLRGVRSVPVGSRGTLRLDGAGAALGCEVRAAGSDGVHLALVPESAARDVIAPLLRQAEQRHAA